MKPGKHNPTGRGLQEKTEAHQNIRQLARLGRFQLHPGQKLYEMVCVSITGAPVKGLDPETGAFDPQQAEVREVVPEASTAIFGDAMNPELGGPIKKGSYNRLTITSGNIYMAAINQHNARKKIIQRFFPTQ
jgi:hypothetical protein